MVGIFLILASAVVGVSALAHSGEDHGERAKEATVASETERAAARKPLRGGAESAWFARAMKCYGKVHGTEREKQRIAKFLSGCAPKED